MFNPASEEMDVDGSAPVLSQSPTPPPLASLREASLLRRNTLHQGYILIVDDTSANVRLLSRMLAHAQYPTHHASSGHEALRLIQEESPDLILLDISMPDMDGYAVCENLKAQKHTKHIPIIFISGLNAVANKVKGFAAGGVDYITKPFHGPEVLARVETHLQIQRLQRALQKEKEALEQEVRYRKAAEDEVRKLNLRLERKVIERTLRLEETQIEVLERLALAGDFRDHQTGEHTQRVGDLAAEIAAEMGISEEDVNIMRLAARLHDVGKIGISDIVLHKPDRLDEDEYDRIKEHTIIGAKMLAQGNSHFMRMAEVIALSHHERWDGKGYPYGLKEHNIPIEGRIVSVVDVFDALTNPRPYKKAWSTEEALEDIQRNAGIQFDPEVVAAFVRVLQRQQESQEASS